MSDLVKIWDRDDFDFDQAVRDAQAVVAAGQGRRGHLRIVPPAVANLEKPRRKFKVVSPGRERKARLYDGAAVVLLLILSALIGVVVVLASVPR